MHKNIIKEFITPHKLIKDSFTLAKKIYDSGYIPDVLLVLWRGGTPIGMVVHEFLTYKGIKTYHTVIKAESYNGINKRINPRVEDLKSILTVLNKNSKVLIIDDIFDTGCTLEMVVRFLRKTTKNIRIATLYYKIGKFLTNISPDFFLYKTANWIVFPHELVGLSIEEIKSKDKYIYNLLR